jgi:hypothetical protein
MLLRAPNKPGADRPNGPGDSSPGMRPKADSLGEKSPATPQRPEGSRESFPGSSAQLRLSRASRGPSGRFDDLSSLTQGIGLRPKPWARVSRPVGPVLLDTLRRIRRSGTQTVGPPGPWVPCAAEALFESAKQAGTEEFPHKAARRCLPQREDALPHESIARARCVPVESSVMAGEQGRMTLD